jgi:hypothetical protein
MEALVDFNVAQRELALLLEHERTRDGRAHSDALGAAEQAGGQTARSKHGRESARHDKEAQTTTIGEIA